MTARQWDKKLLPLKVRRLVRWDKNRFLSKVSIGGPDDCWRWRSTQSRGYGQLSIDGKTVYASRVALVMRLGYDEPDMDVLHSCDNAWCVNPSHLRFGTHRNNMEDKRDRGRSNARLTKRAVLKMRRLYSTGRWTQTQLAEMFSCDQSNVSRIVNNKVRRHL